MKCKLKLSEKQHNYYMLEDTGKNGRIRSFGDVQGMEDSRRVKQALH